MEIWSISVKGELNSKTVPTHSIRIPREAIPCWMPLNSSELLPCSHHRKVSILSLDRCFLQYKLRKVYFGLYLTYKFEQPKSVTGQTFYSETHRADTGPDNHTTVCGIPPKAVFTSTHDILP